VGTVSSEGTPTIKSSLEGFPQLPTRIRWSVTTSLPSAQVREVRFRVGTNRWWVDRNPPYTMALRAHIWQRAGSRPSGSRVTCTGSV
jgi:hypothetical protein